MNTDYINGFSCAIKEDHSEVVLVVYKNYPVVNDDGDFDNSECDVVSTLMMTTQTAKNLQESLEKLLNSDDMVEVQTDKEE